MSDTRVNRKSRSKSPPKQQYRAAGEVLRARPVEGEVNHGVLTRKIIARFPKILAALAK
jgi:hypothetical protein